MAEFLERLKQALEGRYEIEREIGRGGSATVFLARDLKHPRNVAIKVLKPELAAVIGPERFLREIEVTARFNHPHILPLYESGISDGLLYYAMPHVEGESLRDLLRREKQLSLEDSIRFTTEVASALDYAHREGLIHRDIKPENILLVDGSAVVADFGIAKALDEVGGDALTQTGIAIGTPAYMSPEQASGEGQMDARSDLYSLGCIFYEMLAGRPPFVGSSRESVMRQQLLATPTEITAIRAAIPSEVEQSLSRVLSKTPADRYSTPIQFVEALTKPPSGKAKSRSRGSSQRNGDSAWRSKGVRWVIGVLATVILAVGTWWVYEDSRRPSHPPSSTSNIAVFPFSVRGGEEGRFLGESVASLLARALDGAGIIRVADFRALLDYTDREFGKPPTPAQALAASERFGAGVYVLGAVTVTGDQLRIEVTMYGNGVESKRIPATSQGAEEDLTSLVDDIAQQLLAEVVGVSGVRFDSVAVVTTKSFPALKQYLIGEREYRTGNIEAATAAFAHAVELDSTFALAWARLSEMYDWVGDYGMAVECAERARENSDRLSHRDRLHLDAQGAYMRGDPDEAESIYRLIVLDHPDDSRAWRNLAETLFTYNCFRGRSVLEAREPRYKTLELNPKEYRSLFNLIRLELLAENLTIADSLINILESASASPIPSFFKIRRIYGSGDSVQIAHVESLLTRSGLMTRWLAALVIHPEDPTSSRGILRELTGEKYSPAERAFSHATLALLDLERGRPASAREELRSAERLDLVIGSAYRALLSGTIFLKPDIAELNALFTTIEGWPLAPIGPGSGNSHLFFRRMEGTPELIQAYLLGHLSIQRGDRDRGLEYARRLENWNGSVDDDKWAHLYAQSIRAVDAWKRKQSESALSVFEEFPIISQPAGRLGFRSESNERFLRAELLFGLGRYMDARGWYVSMNQVLLFDSPYRGPSYLRLAEIAERLEKPEEAIEYYMRFIELWKDCDPEMQPMVESAQRRLEALMGEPSASSELPDRQDVVMPALARG